MFVAIASASYSSHALLNHYVRLLSMCTYRVLRENSLQITIMNVHALITVLPGLDTRRKNANRFALCKRRIDRVSGNCRDIRNRSTREVATRDRRATANCVCHADN